MAEVFPTLMETINTYFRILMSPKCKDHKENYTKAHHIQTVQNLWWREDLFSFLAAAYWVPRPGIKSQPQMQPLTHCARLGMQPASWHCKDATHLIVPHSGNS